MYKQYQIRYLVQGGDDGVLWHDVATCMSEEEAIEELNELQGDTLKVDNAWSELDECIDTIAKNELKGREDDTAHNEIAWQLYDELQHHRIINYEQYSKRLYELLDLAHPNDERVGDYVADIETIMHDKWSFGFCDMCDEVIFYDEDTYYDLCGDLYDYERERVEEHLPKYQKELGRDIQDVCISCFNKLTKGE